VRPRRLRPTLLLETTTVIAVLSCAILGFILSSAFMPIPLPDPSSPLVLFGVVALLILGMALLEFGPGVLAWLLTRYARRHDLPLHSRWFVDVEQEEKADREADRSRVGGNPSLW
jgi:hypothetical protein